MHKVMIINFSASPLICDILIFLMVQGVTGILSKLHRKLDRKNLTEDQRKFYQSAYYAYEVCKCVYELIIKNSVIYGYLLVHYQLIILISVSNF